MNKIVKVFLYICASFFLLLLIGILWFLLENARLVWESPQISAMAKMRITFSRELSMPERVYILQPDRRNKFILVKQDNFFRDGERHIIYNSAGKWLVTVYFEQSNAHKVTIEPIFLKSKHELYLVNSKLADPLILWRKSSKTNFTVDGLNPLPYTINEVSAEDIEMADELISTGNWQFFLAYADALMKNDPAKYSPLVIRYAAEEFTAKEKALNSAGIISAVKVQQKASRLEWFYCKDGDGNYINLGRR